MNRVVIHWTAGTNEVSALDKQHYHFIVDGRGVVHEGNYKPEDNENTSDGRYAAHTLNCNTGAIGISVAGMAGAVESPFNAGKFPINENQVRSMCRKVGDLCRYYNIPVTPTTVLTHAEVQPTLNIPQRGKWDITRLPYRPDIVGHKAVGDYLRGIIRNSGVYAPPQGVGISPVQAPSTSRPPSPMEDKEGAKNGVNQPSLWDWLANMFKG